MIGVGAVSVALTDAAAGVQNMGQSFIATINAWGFWGVAVLAISLSISLAVTAVFAFVRFMHS